MNSVRKRRAAEARRLNMISAQGLTNEQAVNMPGMFPEWNENGVHYEGEGTTIVSYNGQLYRCVSEHDSQENWKPDTSPSLWVVCADPKEEWPEWRQPAGGHDAYSIGAKVAHKDKHWVSAVDSNTWEPGVYGWEEQK